jgi:hypothetical protein
MFAKIECPLILWLILVYVHGIFLQTHRLHTFIGNPISEPPPFKTVNSTQPRSRRRREQPRGGKACPTVPRNTLHPNGRMPRPTTALRPLCHLAWLEAVQHAEAFICAAVIKLIHTVHEKWLF